ncbi:MAG: arginine--tRNA ligase [Candidatus Aenigmatarchaeota archaeon]
MSNPWFELKSKIAKEIRTDISKIEEPTQKGFGDFAYQCFEAAKGLKEKPNETAERIAKAVKLKGVKAKAIGPYVNFYIDWNVFGQKLLEGIDINYGRGEKKKKALIEHTSINPNASPHVGRARNAIIGDSIVRILKFLGYDTEVHYWVNDMGKQIALLVWGCRLRKFRFSDLLKIYVWANKKMEKDPKVEREVFNLLSDFEKGDKKVRKRFKEVVDICVKGQKEILKDLNVHYDYFDYGSEVFGKTGKILEKLEATGKLVTDEHGRKVLPYKDTFFVLARGDGTSLYGLRDIAYTLDKLKKAKDMNIIVLGEDQKLYFEQLSHALGLLGYKPPRVVHYSFVLLPTGKMSTRKGEVVLLEDFLFEAYGKALEEVKRRYPELRPKEMNKRAKAIAAAAVRYTIVKVSPDKNVVFKLDDALRFEGDTGPYLQYTHARAGSILKKAKKVPKKFDARLLEDKREMEVMKKLSQFPGILEKSVAELKPHLLAVYLHELADLFNEFYQNVNVLRAETKLRNARLQLVKTTKTVLKNGLGLLGIEAPEKM